MGYRRTNDLSYMEAKTILFRGQGSGPSRSTYMLWLSTRKMTRSWPSPSMSSGDRTSLCGALVETRYSICPDSGSVFHLKIPVFATRDFTLGRNAGDCDYVFKGDVPIGTYDVSHGQCECILILT